MSETDPTSEVAALTVELLSAYLANNTVPSSELAELIRSTRAALTEDATPVAEPAEAEQFTPAVSIRKSLASPAHIISLIDGKPYKTLKRHLASHGLTPDAYRSRYNLPAGYPMVAPDYAAHRRAVAQKIGLGSRKSRPSATESEELATNDVAQDSAASDASEPKAPMKRATRGSGKKRASTGENAAAEPTQGDASALPKAADASETAAAGIEESSSSRGRGKSRSPRGAKERSEASPKSSTPKARGKTAGSARAKSAEAVDAVDSSTAAPASTETSAAETAATSKPRGRIGLFKKTEDDGSSQVGSDAPPKKLATRAKKPKRMARSAGSGASSQSGSESTEDNQG